MKRILILIPMLLMTVLGRAQYNVERYDIDHDGMLTISDVTLMIGAYLGEINFPVETITLSQTEATIYLDETLQLKATVVPPDADNPGVKWMSTNEKVATVDDNGLVTPLKAGKTNIIAVASDGEGAMASCAVTVSSNSGVSGDGITLTTLAAESTGPVTYKLQATVEGLETLQSGTYSVFFYYSKTNDQPDATNGTRVAAQVDSTSATYSLSDLDMCSTYYYRIAVVPFSGDITYGAVRQFTVKDLVTPGAEVNLGFGLAIAGYDLGATTPEGTGLQYAWGETEAKTSFSKSNYQYYSTNTDIYLGLGNCISGTEYDAATQQLGDGWRIPSSDDFSLLTGAYTTWTSITYKGVSGYLVKSRVNGNATFIRSSNHWLGNVGSSASASSTAYYFSSSSSKTTNRYSGCYIRAVKAQEIDYKVGEPIDLGLSVKWASFNVGATSPEEYGLWFAWGETEPKGTYNWSTYFDTTDGGSTFIKYNNNGGKTVLDLEDDAAHVNWGGNWRMPTYDELNELKTKCTWTWTTQNGVYGQKVTGPNGNSLFLPAAGYRYDSSLNFAGSTGYFWSSSLYESDSYDAWLVNFGSGDVDWRNGGRCIGRSVRPVCP